MDKRTVRICKAGLHFSAKFNQSKQVQQINVNTFENIKANIATAQKDFPTNSKVVVVRRASKLKVPSYFDVYLVQEGIGGM